MPPYRAAEGSVVFDLTYRKDLRYPTRDPKSGFYHGYGGVRAFTSPVRTSSQLRAILIHTTDNPHGNTDYHPEAVFLRDSPDVSAGYVVSSHDSTIVQLAPDTVITWHAGDCADNDFENPTSIGIEIAWTGGKGPLPAIAIDNTTKLVRSLLQQHPTITKIDTHRGQAVPKGRKPDPLGWPDAVFYPWRDRMLKERGTAPSPSAPPDPWTRWGTRYPLPVEQRTNGIPALWRENLWLGEARSFEDYSDDGLRSLQWFQHGGIYYEKLAGICVLITTRKGVP